MARSARPAGEDEGRDVDFVVGEAEDGADEELLSLEDAGRSTRRRLELGIGALALLVVVLIARAALGGSGSAPQAGGTTSATPSTSGAAPIAPGPIPTRSLPTGPVTAPPLVMNGIIPSAEATGVLPVPLPEHVPTRHGDAPQACPGHHCADTGTLPAQVTAAVQDAFPESTVEHAFTVRLRGGRRLLWYREVDVRIASELMVLRVEAPAHGQRSGAGFEQHDGQVTTYYDGTLGPWHVTIEVDDQLGGKVPVSQLRRLAADDRIVST